MLSLKYTDGKVYELLSDGNTVEWAGAGIGGSLLGSFADTIFTLWARDSSGLQGSTSKTRNKTVAQPTIPSRRYNFFRLDIVITLSAFPDSKISFIQKFLTSLPL
jgi:hypothetical protein